MVYAKAFLLLCWWWFVLVFIRLFLLPLFSSTFCARRSLACACIRRNSRSETHKKNMQRLISLKFSPNPNHPEKCARCTTGVPSRKEPKLSRKKKNNNNNMIFVYYCSFTQKLHISNKILFVSSLFLIKVFLIGFLLSFFSRCR